MWLYGTWGRGEEPQPDWKWELGLLLWLVALREIILGAAFSHSPYASYLL